MSNETFSPGILSGVKLTDDGTQIIFKSSVAGNFIVKKTSIKEILISSATGFLSAGRAILIIIGDNGELVRSDKLNFEHAKSIKEWIESRLAIGSPELEAAENIPRDTPVQPNISSNNETKINPPKNKGCLLGCGGIILVVLLLMIGSCMGDSKSTTSKNSSETKASSTSVKAESPEIKKDNKNIEIIRKSISGTKEEAEKIYAVLKQIGINEIDSFEGTVNLGYTLASKENIGVAIMPVYLNENKTVKKIVFKNVTLYENGDVLNNIKSGMLTNGERQTAISKAKEVVLLGLKAPSTAKFPDNYSVGKANDIIQVTGYVDAQNSFGAMIRSDFSVKFDKNFNAIDLKINSR